MFYEGEQSSVHQIGLMWCDDILSDWGTGEWYSTYDDAIYGSTDFAYSGNKSVKYPSGLDAKSEIDWTAGNNYAIDMMCYIDATSIYRYYLLSHGDGSYRATVIIPDSLDIKYHDGVYHDTGADAPAQEWFKMTFNNFDFSSHTFDIYLNNSLIKEGATMRNIADHEDQISIGGQSSNTDNIYMDVFRIRKYTDPEPSALLGEEQNIGTGCTSPTISSLTNSTPGTTSVTITWTTDQSADNRVKYSKNSDLSDALWSSWANDTSSVSITLTGLDPDTTYYYQAWSYNGTNSSCYTTEPSSQPFRSFTTQSSGGQYTITLAQGYNMIGWTSITSKTSSELCSIVPNCTWVYKKNPSGSWITKQCGYPGGDFSVSRGFGFMAYITQECDWTRDE